MSDARHPGLLPSSAEAAARVRAEKLIGQVVSKRYRITDLIAMGGMGAVYRGEHMLMHKRVAIKILHPEIDGLPDLVKRFEREAVAGAHITHPNVAAATDFGELDDGSYFLVLEYVRGVTLHELIRRGPLEPRRAVHIARQLCSALDTVHQMGIVHRDVKPRNIMVSTEQRDLTKLIDFGLAKVNVDRLSTLSADEEVRGSLEEGRLTGIGIVFGTIAYLAPEAALGMDAVDLQSDLYAVGMVLYEMLAGKHPFDAEDPVELFRLQRTEDVPSIVQRRPEIVVPREIESVALKLLEKLPEKRYESAAATIAALDAAVASAGYDPLPSGRQLVAIPPPSMTEETIEAVLEVETLDASSPPADIPISQDLSGRQDVDRWSPEGERHSRPWKGPIAQSAVRKRSLLPYAAGAVTIALLALLVVNFSPLSSRRSGDEASAEKQAAPSETQAPASRTESPADVPAAARPAPAPPAPVAAAASGASASAAPAEAAAPPPDASASPDVSGEAGLRAMFVHEVASRDWVEAQEAFYSLVGTDRPAFTDKAVALSARELAVSLERMSQGDKIFAVLTDGLGSDGLDVLYDIVQSKGGTRAATRATEILKHSRVLARATPEMRVAFDLREAPCDIKLKLFDRAVKEGDGRALAVLRTLGYACFKKSRALTTTIAELTAKIVRKERAASGAAPPSAPPAPKPHPPKPHPPKAHPTPPKPPRSKR